MDSDDYVSADDENSEPNTSLDQVSSDSLLMLEIADTDSSTPFDPYR